MQSLLLSACGDTGAGRNDRPSGSYGELHEIVEDETETASGQALEADPAGGKADTETAVSDDNIPGKSEAEDGASEIISSEVISSDAVSSDQVDINQTEEFDDPYDTGDVFYNETGATIFPHGSLYPEGFDPDALPEYSGKKYVLINDGVPFFTEKDRTEEAFEYYSSLDELGRCGTAYANVCRELMPVEKRGDISEIHPTGWRQRRYDGIVDADPPYLYNRSHLIAYKLAGENANVYNLITGTRYFNADGMSYVEDKVTDYVRNTGHHVLYRVTPVFFGEELLSRGVLMEALSVEDDRICFCEFVYNVQPGIYIDYSDGYNKEDRYRK
ncbi:MAG: DNA/RNA non-specific endonuclease [Lachnospiraceae bacterium]|nr:DNA/RNA non-specific endonuclease [Lachnospiraceae bacterium]